MYFLVLFDNLESVFGGRIYNFRDTGKKVIVLVEKA